MVMAARPPPSWRLLGARLAASAAPVAPRRRFPPTPPTPRPAPGRRFASAAADDRTAPAPDDRTSAELEEEQHLAKQLSRLSERSRRQQRSWSGAAASFPRTDWSAVEPLGLRHYNSAQYEHEGLSEIHHRSFSANVLLEVRDVRVPASSHHPSFVRLARHRTHLICYTHADLIDAPARDRVERWTAAVWPESRSLFVDTRADGSKRNDALHIYDRLYDGLLQTIEERGNNVALTVGVANVGKSSVLSSLLRLGRQRGALPKNSVKVNLGGYSPKKKQRTKARITRGKLPDTEDRPGKTRRITEYLLREKPKAYFMDVPGITPPAFFFRDRPAAWFGYGATNLLPLLEDGTNDLEMQRSFCEYILHCANRDGVFQYVDALRLDGPTDDVDACLARLANKWRDKLTEEKLQLKRCTNFLKLFNTGNFGPLVLDDMSDFSWKPFVFEDRHFARRGGGSPEGGSGDRRRAPRFDREAREELSGLSGRGDRRRTGGRGRRDGRAVDEFDNADDDDDWFRDKDDWFRDRGRGDGRRSRYDGDVDDWSRKPRDF